MTVKHENDMDRLTHYLRAGGFKKIAGDETCSQKTASRRNMVVVPAVILILIGLYKAFF